MRVEYGYECHAHPVKDSAVIVIYVTCVIYVHELGRHCRLGQQRPFHAQYPFIAADNALIRRRSVISKLVT